MKVIFYQSRIFVQLFLKSSYRSSFHVHIYIFQHENSCLPHFQVFLPYYFLQIINNYINIEFLDSFISNVTTKGIESDDSINFEKVVHLLNFLLFNVLVVFVGIKKYKDNIFFNEDLSLTILIDF
jgi:hypothetical protein